MAAPLTTVLAAHLAQIDIAAVAPATRRLATTAIVDTIGVTLAGAVEPTAILLRKSLGDSLSTGPALVHGTRERLGLLDAAMLNGTAAHAIDYDDMASAMGGHPSVPVVPVVFALGEALHVSGMTLLEAYMVGFEAECRIGRVVHPHHYRPGWHPTATLGVFGAAAAACRLLGLDVERTSVALAIAASMASGVKANFGTMVKPLHVGHAARDGLLAAQLAKNGYTANPAALEHKQGFFNAYDGLANVTPERLLDFWGETLEIEQADFGLKQFPCCGSTHPAARSMIELVSNTPIDPQEVEAIEIRTHADRLPHTDNPRPSSPLQAKFSIQYATVRALLDGGLRLADFEGSAFEQPEVRRLLERVQVRAYVPETGDPSGPMAAEVNVTLRSGRVLSRRVASTLGRGAADPMSDTELWQKFSDCAAPVLTSDAAARAFDALNRLDQCTDINRIVDTLAGDRPEINR